MRYAPLLYKKSPDIGQKQNTVERKVIYYV